MVTTLKIVVGAMVFALASFLGVGAWMHLGPGGAERPTDASFFTWVAVAWSRSARST